MCGVVVRDGGDGGVASPPVRGVFAGEGERGVGDDEGEEGVREGDSVCEWERVVCLFVRNQATAKNIHTTAQNTHITLQRNQMSSGRVRKAPEVIVFEDPDEKARQQNRAKGSGSGVRRDKWR